MKHRILRVVASAIALAGVNISAAMAADKTVEVEAFPLTDVRVTSPRIQRVQKLAISYILGLDADRLVAPYLREAGLEPLGLPYPNWESMGLDGHMCGHYLSALSHMYAATGDKRLKERLDYTVSELVRAQLASTDGYLCGVPGGRSMWQQVSIGNIDAGAFSLNSKWVPLYNIHKTMSGLRDAYLIGGNNKARTAFLSLLGWFTGVVSNLTDDKIQYLLQSEHGGLNEVYADAYKMTGLRKHLQMAKRLTHNTILTPLLDHQDKLTGMHANTQIPKVIGIMAVAKVDNDVQWHSAADYFWHTVVGNRSVSIGGNSVREHFNPTNNFQQMIESEQGIETCNTYNMLKLTKMLFCKQPRAEYADYYERAMLNHILSSISDIQGGFVYFTPMRPAHYRVYSQPQTSMWCCVGSGIENHSRYGEIIYAHRGDEALYLNTFLASKLDWKDIKTTVEVKSGFPFEEEAEIVVTTKKPRLWTLKVRKPEWAENMSVECEGNILHSVGSDGYFSIDKTWEGTDTIRIKFPMKTRATDLPDKSGYYSFQHGPLVLAADMGTADQTGLYADASRGGHIAAGPKRSLADAPAIILRDENEDILSHIGYSKDDRKWHLTGVLPEKYENMSLVPFIDLSEHRYSVYFRTMTQADYDKLQEEILQKEKEREALDVRSIDKVTCGEQQPETDHQYKQSSSSQGMDDDGVHWRETKGYFSYAMKSEGADHLAVTFRQLPSRQGRIFIDDVEVGTILMGAEQIKTIEFELPEGKKGEVTVRFEPVTGISPRIYEVRTVKKE